MDLAEIKRTQCKRWRKGEKIGGQQLTKQKDKVRKESCYLSIPGWSTQIHLPTPIHKLNTVRRGSTEQGFGLGVFVTYRQNRMFKNRK